jgi:hypothetical protein
MWKVVLSGAIGNLIPGVIFNPCNVIKVRYMESHKPTNLAAILKDIYKHDGLQIFRKGLGMTMMRDFLWGMIYFPLFSSLKNQHFSHLSNNQILVDIWSSGCSAAISTLFTSGVDATRLFQQKTVDPKKGHTNLLTAFKLALVPSRKNLNSTLTGVARVTATTVAGHVTFLAIVRNLDSKN